MKILKKNVKLIVGIIIGMLLTGGIVFATGQYLASEITYTKSDRTTTSVSDALNDLYNAKKEKEDKVYTQEQYERYGTEQYNSGYNAKSNVKWNSGTFTSIKGVNNINVGFIPSKIAITYSSNGCTALYDSSLSTIGSYSCRPSNITFVNLNSTITDYFNIRAIGSTTTMYIGTAGIDMHWFAVE